MAEFESVGAFEAKVENLGNLICKTDAENWEVKNKAVLSIISLISHFECEDLEKREEFLSAKFFRSLKEPIKLLVLSETFCFFRLSRNVSSGSFLYSS
jgi:hypothetical protein